MSRKKNRGLRSPCRTVGAGSSQTANDTAKARQKPINGTPFDTQRFAKNLEKAYKEMWEIFVTGKRPRQVEVVAEKLYERIEFLN
jgi:hypothetical protein